MGFGAPACAHGGERVSWGQAKVKCHPAESSLRGLALGLTAGMMSTCRRECFGADPFGGCRKETRTESSPTLDVVVDHERLIGRRQRFPCGIGAGGRRVLEDVDRDVHDSPVQQVHPDVRFTLGFAF